MAAGATFSQPYEFRLGGGDTLVFKNRLIRSSLGGRMAFYDGQVNETWKKFECLFAKGGVAAVISPTFTIHDTRWSPLQFPKISSDRFIDRIADAVHGVQACGSRYILQLGDPGYHTQTSLFKQDADAVSSSSGFDLVYGYCNLRRAMPLEEIHQTVRRFAKAAERVVRAGCDGIEVTASKGYLIHQFLNPAINRRRDCYGGSLENRFRLLKEVILAIRQRVGRNVLLGVRLSAHDYNSTPWYTFRWPPLGFFLGNGLPETLQIGRWLKELRDENGTEQGIDYLHITNGFGFINRHENPGKLPVKMVRQLFRSNAHLSRKARVRSWLVGIPGSAFLWNLGWHYAPMVNLADAARFQATLGLPVIVNGGFQAREHIEKALESCTFVSMARALLATPDLPRLLEDGLASEPPNRCSFCNRCAVATTMYPIGCYEKGRFRNAEGKHDQDLMERQIIQLNAPSTDI
jgi:2,4-dienoyl-CoA reductase (NADPH2)